MTNLSDYDESFHQLQRAAQQVVTEQSLADASAAAASAAA